jgi:hypothetical protein
LLPLSPQAARPAARRTVRAVVVRVRLMRVIVNAARPMWGSCGCVVMKRSKVHNKAPACLNPRIPSASAQPPRHTGCMAIRFAVQADTREGCVEGLERLVKLDLVPTMLPVLLTDNRWMARAVPRPAAVTADAAPEPNQRA